MRQEQEKYEDWLTTIANTRFVFNTIEELENFLEAPSIHSNGIKRCFTTPQRMRSAFRDLQVEVEQMTDGVILLETALKQYQKAWSFYRDNLSRRSNPFAVALELLRFCYPPYSGAELRKSKSDIFSKALEKDINLPFLILMLLKVIPGYDSKDGDVVDFSHQYEYAMTLLEKFTEGGELFSTLPAITAARDEPNKSRIMLLCHVDKILNTYESYAEQDNIYDVSREMKASYVNLNIEGFWNECGGKPLYTSFWQIENAIADGSYFATYWSKDSTGNLTGIRYTLFLIEGIQKGIIAYLLHPEAIKHRIKGQAYNDSDQVWYKTAMPADDTPDTLPLVRLMPSSVWNAKIDLCRVTDAETLAIYDQWMKTCRIEKPFEMDYLFSQVDGLLRMQAEFREYFSKRFVAEPAKLVISSLDEQLLSRAMAFIEKNMDNNDYDVDEFVFDMAIGRTILYQKIKDLTGMSIKEFIVDIRLKRAAQLLKDSDLTVAEVSDRTGFANPKYFSVCFKRRWNLSPSEFKKQENPQ